MNGTNCFFYVIDHQHHLTMNHTQDMSAMKEMYEKKLAEQEEINKELKEQLSELYGKFVNKVCENQGLKYKCLVPSP